MSIFSGIGARLWRPRPLRFHLIALVLVSLVPTACLAAALMGFLWRQQRDQLRTTLQETSSALGLAVDREIAGNVQRLEALAESTALAGDTLDEFLREARILAGRKDEWLNVLLLRADGERLIDLSETPPEPISPASGPRRDYLERLLATHRPVVSDLFVDPAGRRTVEIAVTRDAPALGTVVLIATLNPQIFEELLVAHGARPDRLSAILDRNLEFLARSRAPSTVDGEHPFAPVLTELREWPNGAGRVPTKDGANVYATWSTSPETGWTVMNGIPAVAVVRALGNSLSLLAVIGLFVLLLASALAYVLARSLAQAIGGAQRGASALARGEAVERVRSNVTEVSALGEALQRARDVLAAQARERALAERERELMFDREREARARAEAASRAKDEFLAMLGHEFRNPLTAIQAATQLLEEVGNKCESATRARQVLTRQTRHLAHIIDDLLDVARAVGGQLDLERHPIDLGEATKRMAEAVFDSDTLNNRVEVQVESVWVEAQPARIDQVIVNLLQNARRFTPEPAWIGIRVHAEGRDAVLEVSDHGAGITPELLPHVFDPFTQATQPIDRAQGGLGVGLTLVRRLVELHGGTVEAESRGTGLGSKFVVRLPRIAHPTLEVAHPALAHAQRRVVIVEDNPDARDMLSAILGLMGHEVTTAADGLEGLEAVMTSEPDIAFIDIGLPGIDGYEMARRIRASDGPHRVTLVAITGYGLPEDRRRAEAAGFDRHLVKPVDPAVLSEIIDEAAA